MRSLILLLLPSIASAALTASFTQDEKSITTEARLPSLSVEAEASPAQGLPPGAFTSTWSGKIVIEKRARLYFSFQGKGDAILKVGGEEALNLKGDLTTEKSKRLRLNPGEHEIEITYASLPDGSGSFRLMWEGSNTFPLEPVPSTVFTKSDAPLDPAHLIASHNCTKCHAADFGKSAMPELGHTAPDLTRIGDRASAEWLTRWIAEPDKLKPTTTMPAMVDHTKPEGAQAAADLGAYLATLKSVEPGPAPDKALAQDGGAHFHNLGCIACHTKPGQNEPDFDQSRIPLNNVATKYRGDSLVKFLKQPNAHHEAIKMPNFRLSDPEANSLAAFLTNESTGRHTPDPSEFAPGDATRGKALAASLNCASCHQGLTESTSKAPAFSDLKNWSSKGCLGPDDERGKAPRVLLNQKEKEALIAVAPTVSEKLRFDTPAAYATRQTKALRCDACHANDGVPSMLTGNHADTKSLVAHIEGHSEKLEQSRPPLTHMGAMLQTPYLEKMLLGTAEPRPRPWLDMRMPAFPLHAKSLAHGLAAQHGLAPSTPSKEAPAADKIAIGKDLAGMTGYACVTCHAIGEAPALAAFEVQGINFALAHQRLRPGYFHQWMQNPTRMVADTKMPKYTNDDGSGLRPDILEGDSAKQFEAIRAYLQTVSKKTTQPTKD
ncbi:c-type cytochrome [Akkermansiaceae bacterium]|nr:c-type cytochrome [Akkermansiaceae bacterium]